ncbi:MAG: ribokinase [Pseudomonadota bacterium]
MRKVHVVGSINADFVIQTETLPRAGETIGGGSFMAVPGGKGANQALAARRLGADVMLHASVGDDEFAQLALTHLQADGVDLSRIILKVGAPTGIAFINLAADGENQIAVASGANAAFSGPDIAPATINDDDMVIAQLEIAEAPILAALDANSAFFCLNTAPALPLSDALFARAQLLVMNEIEAAAYADQLTRFDGLVAQTYGARGAALFRNGQQIAQAEPPVVQAVDTTGAGDTFTGALAVALSQGMENAAALQFACAAGALATTKHGAQEGMPTRADVDRLIASGSVK